jgi:antitoxin component YwqK of YwqJK toxin-antitoxin module
MALKMKDSIINNAESIRYFENGKIASKGKYKNDMKEGNWVEYNYDGTIYNSCNYKADLLHGEFRQYDENGRLSSIINHENGEKIFNDGELITYQSNGAIESKCFYKNGKLEGIKTYSSWNNGVVIKEENYINGKLNGLLIERRGNGEIWRTQNYLNGLRNGEGTDKLKTASFAVNVAVEKYILVFLVPTVLLASPPPLCPLVIIIYLISLVVLNTHISLCLLITLLADSHCTLPQLPILLPAVIKAIDAA